MCWLIGIVSLYIDCTSKNITPTTTATTNAVWYQLSDAMWYIKGMHEINLDDCISHLKYIHLILWKFPTFLLLLFYFLLSEIFLLVPGLHFSVSGLENRRCVSHHQIIWLIFLRSICRNFTSVLWTNRWNMWSNGFWWQWIVIIAVFCAKHGENLHFYHLFVCLFQQWIKMFFFVFGNSKGSGKKGGEMNK